MNINLTLEQLFRHISVRISGKMDDNFFVKTVSSFKTGFYVEMQHALIVKNQLIALGLLDELEEGEKGLVKLSELGKKTMRRLNAPQSKT